MYKYWINSINIKYGRVCIIKEHMFYPFIIEEHTFYQFIENNFIPVITFIIAVIKNCNLTSFTFFYLL